MAPAISPRHIRNLSTTFTTKDTAPSIPRTSVASLLAIILKEVLQFSKQTLLTSPKRRADVAPVFLTPQSSTSPLSPTYSPHFSLKRQSTQVLAIPTTYASLNSSPAPGALVGIVLGSIAGFILILWILLSIYRFAIGRNNNSIVEEEIITRHSRRRASRSASRTSRSHSRVMSEVSAPPPRRERVRREEETVIVEEHVSAPSEDDIVEVIEEHSPERPQRGKSGRSGFRTVDPAEFGGGRGPMRKLGRR